MDSLHANSERGRFIVNLVNPSRGLGVTCYANMARTCIVCVEQRHNANEPEEK
jgi:hypothetical protein